MFLCIFPFFTYFSFIYVTHSSWVDLPGNRTPCESHLPFYPVYIQRQFLPGTIYVTGPKKNMECLCDNRFIDVMVCTILVRPNSFEEKVVIDRFHFGHMEQSGSIRPFYLASQETYPYAWRSDDSVLPIMYNHPSCDPPVWALMRIHNNRIQNLIRSASSPAVMQHPVKHVPLSLCSRVEDDSSSSNQQEALCPIILTPFEVGDYVYILKKDADKVIQHLPVVCICFEGMIGMEKQQDDHEFIDPLRRKGDEFSTLEDDYDLYRIVADPEGSDDGKPVNPKPDSSAIPSVGGPSSSHEGFEINYEAFDEPDNQPVYPKLQSYRTIRERSSPSSSETEASFPGSGPESEWSEYDKHSSDDPLNSPVQLQIDSQASPSIGGGRPSSSERSELNYEEFDDPSGREIYADSIPFGREDAESRSSSPGSDSKSTKSEPGATSFEEHLSASFSRSYFRTPLFFILSIFVIQRFYIYSKSSSSDSLGVYIDFDTDDV